MEKIKVRVGIKSENTKLKHIYLVLLKEDMHI